MTARNRYDGFISFDALFSLVPIVLMLFFAMDVSAYLADGSSARMHRQQVFDKVVAAADYTVKSGAVVRNASVRYPNWLDTGTITPEYVEDLRERTGLDRLHVSVVAGAAAGSGAAAAGDYGFCVYRLVVIGDDRRIAKLLVCGG